MSLRRIMVTAVRNLHPVTLLPSRINILYGANGSGKTSVLEAVHLLGLARSFRSSRLNPVIQYEQPACTVFGEVELTEGGTCKLGVSRERQGSSLSASMVRMRAVPRNWQSCCRFSLSTQTVSGCWKVPRKYAASSLIGGVPRGTSFSASLATAAEGAAAAELMVASWYT